MAEDIYIGKEKWSLYTSQELAVSLILNYLWDEKFDKLPVSIGMIGYYLTGRFVKSKTDRYLIKNIRNGIEQLKNNGDVIIVEQKRENYIIDCNSRCFEIKDNSVSIKLHEIQKIFSCYGAYGFNILFFFVNIVGLISDERILKMSQDEMVNKWHMSKTTVNNYIHKLEKIGLLHIAYTDNRANGYLRCCDDMGV